MDELRRHDGSSGFLKRGRWKFLILDVGVTAMVSCPQCGGEFSLDGRVIEKDGRCWQTYECPYPGCDHSSPGILLLGWGAVPATVTSQLETKEFD